MSQLTSGHHNCEWLPGERKKSVLQGGQQFAESIIKNHEKVSHKDLSMAQVQGSREIAFLEFRTKAEV